MKKFSETVGETEKAARKCCLFWWNCTVCCEKSVHFLQLLKTPLCQKLQSDKKPMEKTAIFWYNLVICNFFRHKNKAAGAAVTYFGRQRMEQNNKTEKETQLVYGKNPVAELLKSGAGVDTVYLADTLPQQVAGYYAALAKQAGAVTKQVKSVKMKAMCQTENHQGVAAYASSIEYASVNDLLQQAQENGRAPFLVLADGVEDPHNLGAIIRTAFLCGADGIVIPKRGGAPITPIVMKASAGAAARLPVARVANIGETVRMLKKQNVFVYCADMDGVPLHKNNLTGAIALVMGNEGSGVSPLVKKLCDGTISLCMNGQQSGVDSFNVSVAAGIILYEISHQRASES